MPVLTGIDVVGVQRYVFASNRLRDAVSASWLVHWVTARDGALKGSGGDVLLASGGNAILIFGDVGQARAFVSRYTRRVYDEAPGVDLVVVHREYTEGQLADSLLHLSEDAARAKLQRIPSAPQLGISVTERCKTTGLPASGLDEDGTAISAMVLRWRDPNVRDLAKRRWQPFLRDDNLWFPDDLDDMGRELGEVSLMGVVHVDGNGVGAAIRQWLATSAGNNDASIMHQIGEWSSALDRAAKRTLKTVIDRVTNSISEGKITSEVPGLEVELRARGGGYLLPIRPVLLGGDDITFLCDGRIALDLTAAALDAFSGEIPHLGHITACGGAALVGTHTPFSRAYDLAVALTDSSKRKRKEKQDSGSWIDWHIGAAAGESLGGIRRRSYNIGGDKLLTCRPYRLGDSAQDTESWRWLDLTILGTCADGLRGDQWREHRNKVKDLASLVHEGPDALKRARESWTAAATIQLPGGLDTINAFLDGNRTPLLDAIELMDIYLKLPGGDAQ